MSTLKNSPVKGHPSSVTFTSCWLKTTDPKYHSIELQDKKTLSIGRTKDTNITDPRVARRQIEATLNLRQKTVQIKQTGRNDSGLNGKAIRMGLVVTATEGDSVELCLPNGTAPAFAFPFSYRVSFESDSPLPSTSASITASKRGNSSNGQLSPGGPPLKIPKMFQPKGPPSSSAAEEFRKDSLLSTKGRWEAIKGDDFFVYINDESVSDYKLCVGAFDLDGTLIKTKSGRVFPKDEHDWVFRTSNTVTKLQSFFSQNPDFKFVIFTNQNGIKKPDDAASFKRKIGLIASQMGIPCLVLVATKKDAYRKPMTGGWDVSVQQFNQGIEPDLSKSFYCGDAAGRPKDFSKSDRLFALNVGIPFKTPEEFFEGNRALPFTLPLFSPKDFLKAPPSNAHIQFPHSKEMIVMVGYPASGKSSFVKSVLLPQGFVHINRDSMKTMPKCLQATESALREGKCVVIDNTNPTQKDREAFLKLAKQHHFIARCFRVMTDHVQALHNNKFRQLTGDLPTAVPDVAFNTFKSSFQEPEVKEGFEEIVPVYFVPEFPEEARATLYEKYLLDK